MIDKRTSITVKQSTLNKLGEFAEYKDTVEEIIIKLMEFAKAKGFKK